MRVLVVDNSKQRLQTVRQLLAREFPSVEVTEYDTDQQGRPGPWFDWSLYDVSLIGDDLESAGNGIDWVREYRSRPGFPPAILMLNEPDVALAARAVRAGAHGVVGRHELNAGGLAKVVEEAMAGDATASGSGESVDEATARDARLFNAQLHVGHEGTPGYRFHRLIGQGAMSRVYLAERLEDARTVVLKILDGTLAGTQRAIRRFVQEAAMVSALDSPYVVNIYEHGHTNRYAYIAMEFFARGDLKQRLERGIPRKAALRYMLDIVRGLQVIHDVGIVHRDLKPANVMFRADETLALADFGISKNIEETTELTMAGDVIGTPHYMSPEQARSERVDLRSDFYSAGVMLFEMLAGAKPYTGRSMGSVVYQHIHAEIPRLPAEAAAFQPVIDRLLAKRPHERYASAQELMADLLPLARAA